MEWQHHTPFDRFNDPNQLLPPIGSSFKTGARDSKVEKCSKESTKTVKNTVMTLSHRIKLFEVRANEKFLAPIASYQKFSLNKNRIYPSERKTGASMAPRRAAKKGEIPKKRYVSCTYIKFF